MKPEMFSRSPKPLANGLSTVNTENLQRCVGASISFVAAATLVIRIFFSRHGAAPSSHWNPHPADVIAGFRLQLFAPVRKFSVCFAQQSRVSSFAAGHVVAGEDFPIVRWRVGIVTVTTAVGVSVL